MTRVSDRVTPRAWRVQAEIDSLTMIGGLGIIEVEITLHHVFGIPDILVEILSPHNMRHVVGRPYPGHPSSQGIGITRVFTVYQLTPKRFFAVGGVPHSEIGRPPGTPPAVVAPSDNSRFIKLD